MFRNSVLAFDGSEYSNRALACAKDLAEKYEANLWLVGWQCESQSDSLCYLPGNGGPLAP